MLGKFFQTSDERKRYVIDYTDWLDTDELVSSVTFEVTPSGLVVDGDNIESDGKSLSFYVSGGTTGITYRVMPLMTSNGGQIKEDAVQFIIREP